MFAVTGIGDVEFHFLSPYIEVRDDDSTFAFCVKLFTDSILRIEPYVDVNSFIARVNVSVVSCENLRVCSNNKCVVTIVSPDVAILGMLCVDVEMIEFHFLLRLFEDKRREILGRKIENIFDIERAANVHSVRIETLSKDLRIS
jgi:hypothetical protein